MLQCLKLEVSGSNPDFDITFSINIHHLYDGLFTITSILLIVKTNYNVCHVVTWLAMNVQ